MVTLNEILSEDEKTMKFDDAVEKIKEIADKYSKFKIGKTGQELTNRFDGEYQSTYDKILPICKSENEDLIDQWEKKLIIKFQGDDDYKGKCDNVAQGGGDMEDDAEVYRVYVVVKA